MASEFCLEKFEKVKRERTEQEEEKLKKIRLLIKKIWRKAYPNLEYEVFLKEYSNIGYFEINTNAIS